MSKSVRSNRVRARKSDVLRQLTIFPRGGARRGAGRKPSGERALVTHSSRPALTPRDPVLITTRLVAGLPNLRSERALVVLREVFARGAQRFGFRLIEYSIQSNHLHLLAEGTDARAIARGMQGLLVRVAKALNRLWQRRGAVLADRYHARKLSTPREVRNALVYVLQNARKHGARLTGIDACSSGMWFDGWRDRAARAASPLAAARSWLLTRGWRRWGLLSTEEAPTSSARASCRAPD
jgi:REP element-mobilizing transposase RayT